MKIYPSMNWSEFYEANKHLGDEKLLKMIYDYGMDMHMRGLNLGKLCK